MSVIEELKLSFRTGGILIKLLLINAAVFIVISLIGLISFLITQSSLSPFFAEYLALPSSPSALLFKPWTLFTYMFLHFDLWHILSNCIALYFGGRIFQEFLGEKRLLGTYILGGIAGGLFYIICFNLFPAFSNIVEFSYALGASASSLAILIAIATYLPEYTVYLMFFGPVRLKWIAAIFVLLDLISIPQGNAGGHLAHLGGALWGFTYVRMFKNGTDVVEKIAQLWNSLKPSSKSKLKVDYVNKEKRNASTPKHNQAVIDAILDKISKSGYNSLSNEEKEILFKASNDKN